MGFRSNTWKKISLYLSNGTEIISNQMILKELDSNPTNLNRLQHSFSVATLFQSDDIEILRVFIGSIHAFYPSVQITVYGRNLMEDIVDEIMMFNNTKYESADQMPKEFEKLQTDANGTSFDKE